MSEPEPEWTVLVTAAQSGSQAPITAEQMRAVLDSVGPADAWIQYPPASGRGHGFETRWWQHGQDAARVAAEAIDRYRRAVEAAGLDVSIILVHVASPEERLNEAVIGLQRRVEATGVADPWNVMLRAIATSGSQGAVSRTDLDGLLRLLPGSGSSGFCREGLVEVRFWVAAEDAVDAAEHAAAAFESALAELGVRDWWIVRVHTTSLDEAERTAYLGIEKRLVKQDRSSLPIAIEA